VTRFVAVPPPVAVGELPTIGPAAVTLGVFDGVHLGHQAVLAATVRGAAEAGAASVALVFFPHPDEVLRPGSVVPRLAAPATSLEWIGQAGIERPILLRFDDALRSLPPEGFLDALAPALDLRILVMTPGTAFGRGRAGTPERLRELGSARGFGVVLVEPVEVGGAVVSSSRVRQAVAAGDLEAARELLGRPPIVEGTVVHGDGRGRGLGFPTANLETPYPGVLPPLGIYRGRTSVAERGVGPGHPSLVSIGVRPTFGGGRPLAEVYLLDYDGDLYDAWLRVELLDRLRDEERFATVEALVAQMRRDETEGRRRFAAEAERVGGKRPRTAGPVV